MKWLTWLYFVTNEESFISFILLSLHKLLKNNSEIFYIWLFWVKHNGKGTRIDDYLSHANFFSFLFLRNYFIWKTKWQMEPENYHFLIHSPGRGHCGLCVGLKWGFWESPSWWQVLSPRPSVCCLPGVLAGAQAMTDTRRGLLTPWGSA